MNQFTLKFTDSNVENSYLNQRESIQEQSQSYCKMFLMLLLITEIIENVVNDYQFAVILHSTGLLIISASCYFNKQNLKIHEPIILVSLLIYNIQHPISQILNEQLNSRISYNSYFICMGTIGMLTSLNFMKKIIAISLIFAIQLIALSINQYSWKQFISMVISTICILYSFYICEREMRIQFIVMNNKNVIEEQLYKQVEIQSYIIHYDYQYNTFKLIRHNQNGNITENRQHEFINIIRSIRVVLSRQRELTVKLENNLNLTKKLTLEQILLFLFTKKRKNQNQMTLSDTDNDKNNNCQLIGFTGLDIHHIQIHQAFDLQPCLILFIKENKKQSQNKSLRYKLKIQNKLLDKVQTEIQYYLRYCLICLKQVLIEQNEKKSQISQLNNNTTFVKYINCFITKTYNEINNVTDFSKINHDFTSVRLLSFDLINSLQDCIEIVKFSAKQISQVSIELVSYIKDSIVYQDQRKIKQLILNCLFFILPKSKQITIILKEEFEKNMNQRMVKFEIQYQGQIFAIDRINNLPILNPQSLEELKHNSQKQLNLEIPIALMIIRQLGPYNQLQFKQNVLTTVNSLTFFIFKSLQQYHLIPIISLRPSENFITNKKLFKLRSNTYKAEECNNFMTSQEPQLNTFRKISEQMISKY